MKKLKVVLLASGIVVCLLLVKYILDNNAGVQAVKKGPDTVVDAQSVKYLAQPQFSNCSNIFVDGLLRYEKTDPGGATRYGYIDENGKIITDAVFDDTLESVYFSSHDPLSDVPKTTQALIPVKKGGKWGYINRTGKVIIDFKYESANVFSEGKACVKLANKWGYINMKGQNIIPFSFDEAYNFINGASCVSSNDKYGFINDKGNWLAEPAYNYLNSAVLGSAFDHTDMIIFDIAEGQGLLKMVNNSVKIVAQPTYSKIFPFRKDEAFYVINEKDSQGNYTGKSKMGYLDKCGEKLISWSGDGQEVYGALSEGLRAVFDDNNKWGYIDKDKKTVIPFIYDKAEDFSNGTAVVCLNNKYGIIDSKNNTLLSMEYDSLSMSVDTCIVAEKNSCQQLIDTKTFKPMGKIYKEIVPQDRNFLIVQENNKFGLINNKGLEIVPSSYESTDQLSSAIRTDIDSDGFWLKQEDKWTYMDFGGNRKFPEAFDDVESFRFGYAPVKKNGHWGVIDKNGNNLVEYKFDKIFVIASYKPDSDQCVFAKMAAVQLNNQVGLISLQ